jgi:hypothetical protein
MSDDQLNLLRKTAQRAVCSLFIVMAGMARANEPILPADHAYSALGAVDAVDLQHGQGTAQLTVRRVWLGPVSG